MLEYEAHRNMAFILYAAMSTPDLKIRDVKVQDEGSGLTSIAATIVNSGMMPTHSAQDLTLHLTGPDIISLNTKAEIISAEIIAPIAKDSINSKQITIDNIGGNDQVTVRWLVKGNGPHDISVKSIKGGMFNASVHSR